MVQIVVDSGCDLTDALQQQLHVADVVPFYLRIGGEALTDDDELTAARLLEKMRVCTGKMQSACPSPARWKDAFLRTDGEGALAVTLSSKLSGMYQAARAGLSLAQEERPELVGHVIDSLSAACGETLVALKLHRLITEGLPFGDIVAQTEAYIKGRKTYFVLDDVSNLVKNGRMGRLTGVFASTLGIKPVLGAKEGEIALAGQLRGRNIVGKLLDTMASVHPSPGGTLTVSHCHNPEVAQELTQRAMDRFGFAEAHILETGGLATLYACEKGVIMSF